MELNIDPKRRQILDDTFDAFSMLAGGNLVSLYDMESQVTRYGAAAVDLFQLPGEYIPVGAMDWGDYVHPEDRQRYYDIMGRLTTCETLTYDLAYRVRTKDGRYGMFRAIGAVLRDGEGKPSLVGGMMINEGLMENTDPITVLRNQYGFLSDLPELMRSNRTNTILLLGIDNLARINESQGYGHGNHVLQQVGWLIQELTGSAGTLYRMDGAKFAFATETMDQTQAAELYEKLRRKLQNAIRVDGVRHSLTASGGMIAVRGLRMDARTVLTSLRFALHESRTRKHGALVSFDSGAELDVIEAVRKSLLNGAAGFYLCYQPIIRATDEKRVAVESFVRWRDERFGEVLPMRFLPVLEQDAVFEELGNWILRRAMEDGKRFLERNPKFLIGVNISPVQLEKDYFTDTLLQLAAQSGFPTQNLCLELTMECRALELPHVKEAVETLRAKGVRFLLDDFGSGAASMDFLRELRPDYVKLDTGLSDTLLENEADQRAIKSLTELAAVYGSHVCVKHVETAPGRELLRQYSIGSMQGYLFSHPLPVDGILETCF